MSAITIKAVRGLAATSDDFRRALVKCAENIGCNVDFLATIIAFESAGSFSAAKKNAAGSGATGLIQFMPSTAKRLGTTTAALAVMSATEQLAFVEKYFLGFGKGRLKTLEDMYMAVLWPIAIGKPNDYVLFSEGSTAYEQNKGFDRAGTGVVTKGQVSSTIRAVYAAATTSIPVTVAGGAGILGFLLAVGLAGAAYWWRARS